MRTTTKTNSPVMRNSQQGLYCTSDGLAFLDEQEAINHAEELTDKAITGMTGDQADAEIANIVNGRNWLEEMEELLSGMESNVI